MVEELILHSSGNLQKDNSFLIRIVLCCVSISPSHLSNSIPISPGHGLFLFLSSLCAKSTYFLSSSTSSLVIIGVDVGQVCVGSV